MLRRSLVHACAALLAAGLLIALEGIAPRPPDRNPPCTPFSGWVTLTCAEPQSLVLHAARSRVNASTPFTMTASTVYTRNGAPAGFADIKVGDRGTITALEQVPSGTLLACTVTMRGP